MVHHQWCITNGASILVNTRYQSFASVFQYFTSVFQHFNISVFYFSISVFHFSILAFYFSILTDLHLVIQHCQPFWYCQAMPALLSCCDHVLINSDRLCRRELQSSDHLLIATFDHLWSPLIGPFTPLSIYTSISSLISCYQS